MKIRIETSVDPEVWTRLIAEAGAASFFHEPAWMSCLLESYPYYKPLYVLALDDAGRVAGALPAIRSLRFGLVQLLSLPYGTYGTPLVTAQDRAERQAIRGALFNGWASEARKPNVVRAHLVLFGSARDDPAAAALRFALRRSERTHIVDTSRGFEDLWSKGFSPEARNHCRKAEKLGVRVAQESTAAGIAAIESLYRSQARSWKNHTPFPPGFFARLLALAPSRARLWVARVEREALAAKMALEQSGSVLSWLTCGTEDARRFNATHLLFKTVIEDAAGRGCTSFNMGGSRGLKGLETFKEAMGGKALDYPTFLYEPGWFSPLHRLQYWVRGIREVPEAAR
jgi:CelD/BcsL family acetyltransferase involved in cellulose biosynthesis